MHLKTAYIWCGAFISARQDGPILGHLGRVVRHLFSSIAKFLSWLAHKTHDIHENLSIFKTMVRKTKVFKKNIYISLVGLEPRTLGLEIQGTTHWARNSDEYNLEIWIYLTYTLI